MAVRRVQKSGRVEDRIIDQFMDDVIAALKETNNSISNITQNITILVDSNFISRRISSDVLIPNEKVLLQRNPIIENGVTVTIENGGELYIL